MRNQNWTYSRSMFDVSKACTSEAKRTTLLAFFRVAKGKANTFPFRDWSDYKVSTSEGVLTQLTSSTYQLSKRYAHSYGSETRPIKLPVDAVLYSGSPLSLLASGVDYTLDLSTGIATFGSPTVVTPSAWSGQFNLICRFDTDELRLIAEDLNFFRSQIIPVIECAS